jgi:6-hydroxycyclohex-1-ene-1-carbonyl-CoA dehydrogenase
MKAAVFIEPNQPLEIRDVPTPEPGPDEVLVKVAACGVCHTDLHYIDHGTPTFKKPPLILGHEASGTIAGMGADVTEWSEGDRVLLPSIFACGTCAACRSGRDNVCEDLIMLGNNVDGAYAEYVLAPRQSAFDLPEEIPLEEGAIIADATTTPYHAVVVRGQVSSGDNVVVFGCGGIGANVVQVAAVLGAHVVAVDISEEKLEWAKKLGAAEAIDPSAEERIDKLVRKLTGGGADVAFECVGTPETQEQALASTRNGGRLVLVGYSPKAMKLNSGRVMFREMEIVGSLGCRSADYPRVIEMVRRGKLRVAELVTARYALDDINEAFDGLRAGKGLRSIVTP